MSFQADALAFEPDRTSAAFDNRFPHDSPTAADDRSSIRLTPRHGVGAREVVVRHALYGAPGAPVVATSRRAAFRCRIALRIAITLSVDMPLIAL